MKLVVASDLLDQRAAAVILEDDEGAQELQKAPVLEDATGEHFKLEQTGRSQFLAGDGAPGHEALAVGSKRTQSGGEPVGDRQQRGIREQGRDLQLVGLELVVGGPGEGGRFAVGFGEGGSRHCGPPAMTVTNRYSRRYLFSSSPSSWTVVDGSSWAGRRGAYTVSRRRAFAIAFDWCATSK